MAKIRITNTAEPATPAAGTSEIYVDSTTKALTTKDDAGVLRSASTYAHPNHTGEVTSLGDGAQTVQPTYISNKGLVTAAAADSIPVIDDTDGTLKKVTAQAVADLFDNSLAAPASTAPTLLNNTNVNSNVLMYYRDGRFMCGEGVITWSGAGAGGTWSVTIPDSEVIDTNYLAGGVSSSATGASRIGDCSFYNNGTATFSGPTYPLTTTTIQFFTTIALPGSIFANLDGLKYTFKIPIVGWS